MDSIQSVCTRGNISEISTLFRKYPCGDIYDEVCHYSSYRILCWIWDNVDIDKEEYISNLFKSNKIRVLKWIGVDIIREYLDGHHIPRFLSIHGYLKLYQFYYESFMISASPGVNNDYSIPLQHFRIAFVHNHKQMVKWMYDICFPLPHSSPAAQSSHLKKIESIIIDDVVMVLDNSDSSHIKIIDWLYNLNLQIDLDKILLNIIKPLMLGKRKIHRHQIEIIKWIFDKKYPDEISRNDAHYHIDIYLLLFDNISVLKI